GMDYHTLQTMNNLTNGSFTPSVKKVIIASKGYKEQLESRKEQLYNSDTGQLEIIRSGVWTDPKQRIINAFKDTLAANDLADWLAFPLKDCIVPVKVIMDSGGGWTKLGFEFITKQHPNGIMK